MKFIAATAVFYIASVAAQNDVAGLELGPMGIPLPVYAAAPYSDSRREAPVAPEDLNLPYVAETSADDADENIGAQKDAVEVVKEPLMMGDEAEIGDGSPLSDVNANENVNTNTNNIVEYNDIINERENESKIEDDIHVPVSVSDGFQQIDKVEQDNNISNNDNGFLAKKINEEIKTNISEDKELKTVKYENTDVRSDFYERAQEMGLRENEHNNSNQHSNESDEYQKLSDSDSKLSDSDSKLSDSDSQVSNLDSQEQDDVAVSDRYVDGASDVSDAQDIGSVSDVSVSDVDRVSVSDSYDMDMSETQSSQNRINNDDASDVGIPESPAQVAYEQAEHQLEAGSDDVFNGATPQQLEKIFAERYRNFDAQN